jgi:hypothetical protein
LKGQVKPPTAYSPDLSFTNYLPFALVGLEAGLEAGLDVLLSAVFADLPPLFAVDEALFGFAAGLEALALLAVFAAPPVLAALPADFLASPSRKSPTASATTLIAVSAAPVAAPERISPAASFTASITGDAFFLVVFFAAGFDFAEVEAFAGAFGFAGAALLAGDFAGAALFAVDFDFAGVAFFTVVFLLSFFAAIINLPMFKYIN